MVSQRLRILCLRSGWMGWFAVGWTLPQTACVLGSTKRAMFGTCVFCSVANRCGLRTGVNWI